MAALGESSIPNWANENEDGTTLRTIVNFELKIIATKEVIPVHSLGTINGSEICMSGLVLEPLTSTMRQDLLNLACTAPIENVVEYPENYDNIMDTDTTEVLDRDGMTVGNIIDAYCDKTYKWFSAKIVDADDSRVKIHFSGWSAKHDEWIDRQSSRLTAKGTSDKVMLEEVRKSSNMAPWYRTDILYNKYSNLHGQVPSRREVHVCIEGIDDWCIDYTYANPTLWIIASSGVWYRVAGILVSSQGYSGVPSTGYSRVFHETISMFQVSSHVAMCLLDYLPINPKFSFNDVVSEISRRTNGIISDIDLLKFHNFIVGQISALEKPVEWHAKISFNNCQFITQLKKYGELYSANPGSYVQGSYQSNKKSRISDGSESNKADVEIGKKSVRQGSRNAPSSGNDSKLEPFCAPSDKNEKLKTPSHLVGLLLNTWNFLMNFKGFLNLPSMSVEMFEHCLFGHSSPYNEDPSDALFGTSNILNNIHVSLLSKLLGEKVRSAISKASANVEANVVDNDLIISTLLLHYHKFCEKDFKDLSSKDYTYLDNKLAGILQIGSAWVELARIIVSERFDMMLVEYVDYIEECENIIESIMKESDYSQLVTSLENDSNTLFETSDLKYIYNRIGDAWYERTERIEAPKELIFVGSLVDAFSSKMSIWYPGIIVSKNDDNIVVRFLCFGNNPDLFETIPVGCSYHLAPYLSVSNHGVLRYQTPVKSAVVPTAATIDRGGGHIEIVADTRLFFTTIRDHYSQKDNSEKLIDAIDRLSESFEERYNTKVLIPFQKFEESKLLFEKLNMSSSSIMTSHEWLSIKQSSDDKVNFKTEMSVSSDLKDIIQFLSTLNYEDIPFEMKLQLLNCLCMELLTTERLRSYLEELGEFRYQYDRSMRSKKAVELDTDDVGSKRKLIDGDDDPDTEPKATIDRSKFPDYQILFTRLAPVGTDRDGRQYWIFPRDPSNRIFCETRSSSRLSEFVIFSEVDEIHNLCYWLQDKVSKEYKLKQSIMKWLASNNLPVPDKRMSKRKSVEDCVDINNADENLESLTGPRSSSRRRRVSDKVDVNDIADASLRSENASNSVTSDFVQEYSDLWFNTNASNRNLTNGVMLSVSIDLCKFTQLGVAIVDKDEEIVVTCFKYNEANVSAGEMAGLRINDRIICINDKLLSSVIQVKTAIDNIEVVNGIKLIKLLVYRKLSNNLPVASATINKDRLAQLEKDNTTVASFAALCTSNNVVGVDHTFPLHQQGRIPSNLIAILFELISITCLQGMSVPDDWIKVKYPSWLIKLNQVMISACWCDKLVSKYERHTCLGEDDRYNTIYKSMNCFCNATADECVCKKSPKQILGRMVRILSNLLTETEEILSKNPFILAKSWNDPRSRNNWKYLCANANTFSQVAQATMIFHQAVKHSTVEEWNLYYTRPQYLLSNNTRSFLKHFSEPPAENTVIYYIDGHFESLQVEKELKLPKTWGSNMQLTEAMRGRAFFCAIKSTKIYVCGPSDHARKCSPFVQVELEVLPHYNPMVDKVRPKVHEKYPNNSAHLPVGTKLDTEATLAARRINKIVFRIVTCIIQNVAFKPFEFPVDRSAYPDYYDVITSPMTFETINEKAWKNEYTSMMQFILDVQLIKDNCQLYCENKFPDMVTLADKLYNEVVGLSKLFDDEILVRGYKPVVGDAHVDENGTRNDDKEVNKVFAIGNKFTVCMRLDRRCPKFLVPLGSYLLNLDSLMAEGKFTATTYGTDQSGACIKQDSSGTVVGHKPFEVSTSHKITNILPWRWLAVEWIDVDDAQDKYRGEHINHWDIMSRKVSLIEDISAATVVKLPQKKK